MVSGGSLIWTGEGCFLVLLGPTYILSPGVSYTWGPQHSNKYHFRGTFFNRWVTTFCRCNFLGLGWKLNLCNLDIDKRGVSNMGHPNPPWSGHIIVPVEKNKTNKKHFEESIPSKTVFFLCFFITRRSFSRSVTVFFPMNWSIPDAGACFGMADGSFLPWTSWTIPRDGNPWPPWPPWHNEKADGWMTMGHRKQTVCYWKRP